MTNTCMGRGFLCFAFLMAAFALIAPPHPSARYPYPNQGRAGEISRSSPTMLLAPQGAVDPALYKQPCHGAPDDRQSDLCAQWTSADWTEGGVLVGIFGTMALLVQIGFTWRALNQGSKAADAATASAKHAEDALNEARRANNAGLRAYVDLSKTQLIEAEGRHHLQIQLTNFGQTPATNVIVWINAYLRTWPVPVWPEATTIHAVDATLPPRHPRRFHVSFPEAEYTEMLLDRASFVIPVRVKYDFLNGGGSDEFKTCLVFSCSEVASGEARYYGLRDCIPRQPIPPT